MINISPLGLEEYIFTIGILIAFLGTLFFAFKGRKYIVSACSSAGIKKWHVAAALIVLAVFLITEILVVQPTQLLFFDDVIYQSMALHLLTTGQAWMCNYGSPTACYVGQIFHEPIGTSFDIALGFLVFGVSRGVGYGVGIFIAAVSVIMTFFIAFLLLKDFKTAIFSELLMALSPIVLVWAAPTNSDIHFLAYSLIAVFFLLVFRENENKYTFGMLAFSLCMVAYTKIVAVLFLPVIIIMYLFLEREAHRDFIHKTVIKIKKGLANNAVLLIIVLVFISLTIEFLYAYSQNTPNNFGYVNAPVQNTCDNLEQSTIATSNFGLILFDYNVCGNILFWINAYASQYILQPIFFTALALVGALILSINRPSALAALAVWFFAFFFLYTAFYAGAVIYGVDWRFMLSLIAQASILGGVACSFIIAFIGKIPKFLQHKRSNKKENNIIQGLKIGAGIVLIGLIAISIYNLFPYLSIQPSQIPQAGDARFYETMVYNSSSVIPEKCLVFSYDPTLFFLNNRSAAQVYYLYNSTFMQNISSQYPCLMLDYGYWCFTPNNSCTGLNQTYNLTPYYLDTYQPMNKTFGFYYITTKQVSNSI